MRITNIKLALISIFFIVIPGFASTPKNIIFMISDGCGYNHIDAANFFEHGKPGVQTYEQFPVQYGMTTYSTNGEGYDASLAWSDFDYVKKKPTDSAASATALATGVKTNNSAIGVDPAQNRLRNIIEQVEQMGKATGVVTTVQFSHATPAAFVVHNDNRGNYKEIARDMILQSPVEVIMGAGHPFYDETGQPTANGSFKYVGGEQVWTELVNGTAGNDADGDGAIEPWTLIETREDFQKIMSGTTPKRVIGIPRVAHTLQQERDGDHNANPFVVPFIETVPALDEMARAALNVLDDDPDGFFLMIEGGAVDWASHDNQFGRMIEEEIDFNRAVEAVVQWIEHNSNWDETLLIVTGDHETGYLTGPRSRTDADGAPTWDPIENRGKGELPGMKWHSGGHTNSLIPFFAKGAGSELFHQYAVAIDPVRGQYLDNTDVGKALFLLFVKL